MSERQSQKASLGQQSNHLGQGHLWLWSHRALGASSASSCYSLCNLGEHHFSLTLRSSLSSMMGSPGDSMQSPAPTQLPVATAGPTRRPVPSFPGLLLGESLLSHG